MAKNSKETKKPSPLKSQTLPKELQDKLKATKKKMNSLQKKVLAKFDKYVMGIAILPPPKEPLSGATMPNLAPPGMQMQQPKNVQKPNPDLVEIIVLVDDSDSKKMTKPELKVKLQSIISKMAEEIDKNFKVQVLILSEVWQSCYDAKYDLIRLVAMSYPVYDTGMMQAIRIAEIHKSMTLKKFERYIVSYVLSGSLIRGQATTTSDIDVFVVIDDTDVRRMTRAELKDKLRAIIIGMGIEAGDIAGVKNKLNIQVYILTDFWDSLKEANPIIFTLLRDGVPFYDRGIFMPWKQLLKIGKIKPSPEAIDMFLNSGDQMIKRVKGTLRILGMEDIYYACLTPSQAALMLHGVPPPDPRETAKLMHEIFVKKEKLLQAKDIKILDSVIKVRKDIEHGTKKGLTGKEVDDMLVEAEKFLVRIKKLFSQIQARKEKKDVVRIYDSISTMIRDILRLEGIETSVSTDLIKTFEVELVAQGKVPQQQLRMLNELMKAKKDYEAKKLTKAEVEKVKKDSQVMMKFLVEYLQRKRGREIERTKIRVKHGEGFGEVILLDKIAFIIHDIDHEEKEISKADIKEDGSLGTPTKSSIEELEKYLAKVEIPQRSFIKQPIFDNLKKLYGKDVEILINY